MSKQCKIIKVTKTLNLKNRRRGFTMERRFFMKSFATPNQNKFSEKNFSERQKNLSSSAMQKSVKQLRKKKGKKKSKQISCFS